MRTTFDIAIVGAGPAGSSAAIQLAQRGFAARTLLVDRAVFPREKLCGGGLVRQADRLLSLLNVRIDVPSVPIHSVRFEYSGGRSRRDALSIFRVVRREEFDHALLLEAERRGVTVLQGEAIKSLERVDRRIEVRADRTYRTDIVIGADGANSLVRRQLIGGRPPRFVALEVLTAIDGAGVTTSADAHTAVFDFRPTAEGLRGYYWDFPSIRGGERIMNRGIGGSEWGQHTSLKQLFAEHLNQRAITLGACRLQGATAPLYDPRTPQSAPNTVLAGDAVGIDPWFGEGISVAIGTGILAANAAVDAVQSGCFTFGDYRERIRDSAVGWQLRRSRARARAFYRAGRRLDGLRPWLGCTIEGLT